MAENIEVRHARRCPAPERKCNCDPSYRVGVWSARDRKRIRKTFSSLAEAKTWRADAAVAVRKGGLRATAPVTIENAASAFLDGARAGTIRTRSGRTYKSNTLRGYETALRCPRGARHRRATGSVTCAAPTCRTSSTGSWHSGPEPNTIQNAVMPLRVIYRRALDRGDVAVNPTAGVIVPRARRVPVEAPSARIPSPRSSTPLTTARPGALGDRRVRRAAARRVAGAHVGRT